MAKIRHCIVDQTEYKYCPHCDGGNVYNAWRTIYCCENCMGVHHVYKEYKDGNITLEQAKRDLVLSTHLMWRIIQTASSLLLKRF